MGCTPTKQQAASTPAPPAPPAASTTPNETETLWKELSGKQSNSLLKKHLTPAVYEQLKDKKTKFGGPLADCIRSGVQNPDSGVGLYATDEDAYVVFAPLFDPVIAEYHMVDLSVPRPHPAPAMDASLLSVQGLDPEGKFVLSTRIRVARNLKGYGLGPLLTKEDRLAIEAKCKAAFETLKGDLAGKYYPIEGMDEATRERLVADHFLFKQGDRFLESAGINQHWPAGRGIFHNDAKTFLVWVNEEDQLRIISMENGGNIPSVWKRLCDGVNALNAALEFQHSERFGYLSACPTNLGTGMRGSVHVKLPKVSAQPEFKQTCDKHFIQPRGIHGEHSESAGGVWDLSNKRRLGLSEAECVRHMYEGVKVLIEREAAAE